MSRRENMTQADINAANKLKSIWSAKRKELHLTQGEVADRFHINQSLVSNYLNGAQGLNLKAVMMFATVLEVDPKDIYPELFSDLKISSTSHEEQEFIALYKQCPQVFRDLIKNLMIQYVEAQHSKNKYTE
jgi:transcriptional regulator with XRE-family HTH domain